MKFHFVVKVRLTTWISSYEIIWQVLTFVYQQYVILWPKYSSE